MRVILTLFALIVALTGIGCGSSAAEKAELAGLQGRWRLVSDDLDRGGAKIVYTITGDKMRVAMTDSVGKTIEMDRYKLRLDPDHTPKRVDLELIGPGGEDLSYWTRSRSTTTGRSRGPYKKVEQLTACIYKLDGDTLTICFGNGKADRPTTFDLDAHPRSMVLQRVPVDN